MQFGDKQDMYIFISMIEDFEWWFRHSSHDCNCDLCDLNEPMFTCKNCNRANTEKDVKKKKCWRC